MKALARTIVFLCFALLFCTPANADIHRWTDLQVIPGTEGIEPGVGVQLDHRDLRFADFSKLDLNEANFAGSDLTFAHFVGSQLPNVGLMGAVIRNASFRDTRGLWNWQLYATAGYQNKDLFGIDLGQNNLNGWDLSGQNLTRASLSRAKLRNANLTGANIHGASFQRTTGGGFTKEQLYSTASYQHQDLSAVNLSGNRMEEWDFSGQNLTHADLSDASVAGANFSNANLTDANLRQVGMWDVNLTGAKVRGVSFESPGNFFEGELSKEQIYSTASYQDKDLTGTVFTGVSLEDWDLSVQNLTNAHLNTWMPNVDLTGAQIRGANLADTTRRHFAKERLYSTASYQARNLSGVSLAENNLTGWDFNDQNLTDADLSMAVLANVDLTGAEVRGAKFYATTDHGFTQDMLYSTASYQTGNLMEIGLAENDLSGWDLSGQDLSHADLSSADLRNTSFANANLFGANLSGAKRFWPDATTLTRNMIIPGRAILGLDIRSGEVLSLPASRVSFGDGFRIADGATLEMRVEPCREECGNPNNSYLAASNIDIPIELGGTLRIVFLDDVQFRPWNLFLFNWGQELDRSNTFSNIELPPGSWDLSELYTEGRIRLLQSYLHDGDFNVDGVLDASDIDQLLRRVRVGRDFSYDLNHDGLLDQQDVLTWIHDLNDSYIGDSNLDGEFNSSDLVLVFAAGEYEDAVEDNSTWATGDWDGDGDFLSGDLVIAFADGGYELGPRPAVIAVPEPASIFMVIAGLIGIAVRRRYVVS